MSAAIDWSKIPRKREHAQLGPRPPWFHGGPVESVEIDPRARRIVVSGPRAVRAFHAETGELAATMEAQSGEYDDVFVAPDDRVVGRVSPGSRAVGTLVTWDLESGALQRTLDEPAVGNLRAMDPAGERVLVRDANADPLVVELATGAHRKMRSRPFGGLSSCAFLAGNRAVATSSGPDRVLAWDLATGAEIWSVELPGFGSAIVAPPHADWFAVGGTRGGASICDAATGRLRAELPRRDRAWVKSLSATPDGSRLLAVSESEVIVWDVATGVILREVPGDRDTYGAIAPDGRWFVLGGWTGELRRLPVEGPLPQNSFVGARAAVEALAFDTAGNVVSRERGGRTLTWPIDGGAPREGGAIPAASPEPEWSRERHDEFDRAINRAYLTSDYAGLSSVDANETLALSHDNYQGVRIWPRHASESVELDPGEGATVTRAILHPNGRLVAAGTTRVDAPVQLWDGVRGVPVAAFLGPEHTVSALAFDASGRHLAASGHDRVVRVWSIADWA